MSDAIRVRFGIDNTDDILKSAEEFDPKGISRRGDSNHTSSPRGPVSGMSKTQMASCLISCGQDVAESAIVGALAGASVGRGGIPKEWMNTICDWPRSVQFIDAVAAKLAEQHGAIKMSGPVRYFWPAVIPRNIVFLAIVLGHGFRRLLPPY
jgi:hypothetical protein